LHIPCAKIFNWSSDSDSFNCFMIIINQYRVNRNKIEWLGRKTMTVMLLVYIEGRSSENVITAMHLIGLTGCRGLSQVY
jgi:hypothetical protein